MPADQNPPQLPRNRQTRMLKPRRIGFLLFENFQLLDAAGPIVAFEVPMRGLEPPPYEISVIAPLGKRTTAGPVRSSCGVSMIAEPLPDDPKFDTLIVVGGMGMRAAIHDEDLLDFVRLAAKSARRTCSVCTGCSFPGRLVPIVRIGAVLWMTSHGKKDYGEVVQLAILLHP